MPQHDAMIDEVQLADDATTVGADPIAERLACMTGDYEALDAEFCADCGL